MQAAFTSGAPPPDPNAAAEINQQSQAADLAEPQVYKDMKITFKGGKVADVQ